MTAADLLSTHLLRLLQVAQRIVFNQRRAEEEAEKAERLEKMKENVVVKAERDPDRQAAF